MSLCIVNATELVSAAPHIAADKTLTLLVSDITAEWKQIIEGTRVLSVVKLDVLLLSPFKEYLLDMRILLFFGVIAEIRSCAAECTITLATSETREQRVFDLGCAVLAEKAPHYTLRRLDAKKFAVVPVM